MPAGIMFGMMKSNLLASKDQYLYDIRFDKINIEQTLKKKNEGKNNHKINLLAEMED